MNVRANSMSRENKKIINKAYYACMNGTATEEQKLIYELANAIHCVRTSWMVDDIDKSKRILYENDYTVGIN